MVLVRLHSRRRGAGRADAVARLDDAGPAPPHGKDGVRDETAGSKWANYRLKGSQVAFTDARGQPTLLGNAVLEGKDNVPKSSCITCHAMAGIDSTGQGKFFSSPVGTPASGEFGTSGGRLVQTGFLYSMPRRRRSDGARGSSVSDPASGGRQPPGGRTGG